MVSFRGAMGCRCSITAPGLGPLLTRLAEEPLEGLLLPERTVHEEYCKSHRQNPEAFAVDDFPSEGNTLVL